MRVKVIVIVGNAVGASVPNCAGREAFSVLPTEIKPINSSCLRLHVVFLVLDVCCNIVNLVYGVLWFAWVDTRVHVHTEYT